LVHNSATVCTSTVHNGIFLEIAENPHADWGSLLSHYTRAGKQLEALVDDIDPLFHLNEVIPTEVTEHPAMIPYMLSTSVEKQEKNSITTEAVPPTRRTTTESETELGASLAAYNDKMEELVGRFAN